MTEGITVIGVEKHATQAGGGGGLTAIVGLILILDLR